MRSFEFKPFAAHPGDADFAEKVSKRSGAKRYNHFRLEQAYLPEQEGKTDFSLLFFGLAVVRGAAFDDVGDVDFLALKLHGYDHARQEFASLADERNALRVFVGARAFSDEHEFGGTAAIAEDRVRPSRAKRAAAAGSDFGGQFVPAET